MTEARFAALVQFRAFTVPSVAPLALWSAATSGADPELFGEPAKKASNSVAFTG